MNAIIKVSFESDQPTVLGRDLHQYLDVDTPYRLWFPRMCEYGFSEGIDYTPYIFVHPQNHQEITDHQLTIDMAKEICMIQRNEKGKAARLYFIELEKQWNSPEAVMARALKLADQKILYLQTKIEQDQPLVAFAETCAASQDCILVRELAKIAAKEGIEIGERRLYRVLRAWKMIFPKSTEPYQYFVDRGYFEVAQGVRETANGPKLYKVTRVTPKGQIHIIDRLKKEMGGQKKEITAKTAVH